MASLAEGIAQELRWARDRMTECGIADALGAAR
jgi:hypothetical protein